MTSHQTDALESSAKRQCVTDVQSGTTTPANSDSPPEKTLLDVPKDVLLYKLLLRLPVKDVLAVRRSCRKLRDYCSVPKLWMRLRARDFDHHPTVPLPFDEQYRLCYRVAFLQRQYSSSRLLNRRHFWFGDNVQTNENGLQLFPLLSVAFNVIANMGTGSDLNAIIMMFKDNRKAEDMLRLVMVAKENFKVVRREAVEVIIDHGGDFTEPPVETRLRFSDGLYRAIEAGRADLVTLMLERTGCTLQKHHMELAVSSLGNEAIEVFGTLFDPTDERWLSHAILRPAMLNGDVEICRALITCGAKLCPEDGESSAWSQVIDEDKMNMVLDCGLDLNDDAYEIFVSLIIHCNRYAHDGDEGRRWPIIEKALKCGVDPHRMQLGLVVDSGNSGLVKLLLDNGADVHAGHPLVDAVRRGDTKTVRLLLDHGADVTTANDKGETPLGVAVAWRDYGIEAMLREKLPGASEEGEYIPE